MHLDKINAVNGHKMIPHFLGDLVLTHRGNRKLHREKIVRISSECLPVKEVAPSAHDLSENDTHTCRVHHLEKMEFLHAAVDRHRDTRADDPTVNRQASLTDIENTQQIVFVGIPREKHIINPRSDNSCRDADHCQVNILVRILPGPFRLVHRDRHADQHTGHDHNSVIRNIKSKDRQGLSHMLQIDPKMRKINLHIHKASFSCSPLFCMHPLIQLNGTSIFFTH